MIYISPPPRDNRLGHPRSETCEVLGHDNFDFSSYYGQKKTSLNGSIHAFFENI